MTDIGMPQMHWPFDCATIVGTLDEDNVLHRSISRPFGASARRGQESPAQTSQLHNEFLKMYGKNYAPQRQRNPLWV
jgi:hypothetical protein